MFNWLDPQAIGQMGQMGMSTINPLLPIGLNAVGQLAGYFGGSGDRKRFDKAYNRLGQVGNQGANFAGRTLGQFDAWSQPRLQSAGRQIDRRFGLDTGTGMGELFNNQRMQYGQLAQQLIPQEQMFNANQRMRAAQGQLQAALGRL